ncbi:stage V sporulation protein B [Paenibacillus sp. J22TS3]|uniref:stage V sporulation protein B n=1 Tax=Paenibacillus sp. J22TS3 TaxID=2807192 RepID=UPI001B2D38E9|nr:stage V sporulation protein B [Paenibacillus sp. J22TS3]GIP20805.1 stage V sporulation protein B [Paenibacillus sp. J22TS3]
MNKQSFIQGTMILLAASLINRILGFIPRIMLPRIIGAEGVGLYQLGYPFFLVIVTIISGGIPLAVSKLVAEAESSGQPHRSKVILRTSLALSMGAGFLFTFLCLFGATWITRNLLPDSRVYHTFISMSPMIVIVAVSSVYRGYFQGKQDMIPSATSSIMETLTRILCVLWFSYLMLPMGIEYGAAGAMLGVVAGEIVGMLVLLLQLRRLKHSPENHLSPSSGNPDADLPNQPSPKSLLKRILGISLPVTGGRLVGSLSYLLESITTAQSLALAGIATAVATAQYGALQGMIIPVLLLPGALTSSLAVSLVPSLAEAQARGDMRTIHKRLHQSIKLALVSGAPFAVIMYVMAEPLCNLLYKNTEIAGMLKLMAPFAILIYLQGPLQATLQALDQPGKALTNTLIGAVVKIGLILYLASNPALGIYGAVIAIIANIVIVTLLHAITVAVALKYKFPWLDFLKIMAGMTIMAGAVTLLYNKVTSNSPTWLQFAASCAAGGILYIILITALKLVDRSDMQRVPFIGRWF